MTTMTESKKELVIHACNMNCGQIQKQKIALLLHGNKIIKYKSEKSRKKILIIGSARDKIIQQAFLRILQQMYEGLYT